MIPPFKADPWELNNLAGYKSHKKVSEVMKGRLLKYMNRLGNDNYSILDAPEVKSGQKTLSEDECFQ